MAVAERDEIVEIRFATASPMSDVVRIGELGVRAAWESTALVPPLELYPLRHSRITPDPSLVQNRTIPSLDAEDDLRVARQPPCDLDLDGTHACDLRHADIETLPGGAPFAAPALCACEQQLERSMNDDPRP